MVTLIWIWTTVDILNAWRDKDHSVSISRTLSQVYLFCRESSLGQLNGLRNGMTSLSCLFILLLLLFMFVWCESSCFMSVALVSTCRACCCRLFQDTVSLLLMFCSKASTTTIIMIIIEDVAVNIKNLWCELQHLPCLEISDFNIIKLFIFTLVLSSSLKTTIACFSIHAFLEGHTAAFCRQIRVICVVEDGRYDEVGSIIASLLTSSLVSLLVVWRQIVLRPVVVHPSWCRCSWIINLNVSQEVIAIHHCRVLLVVLFLTKWKLGTLLKLKTVA